jgi:sulfate transport system permease protein
MADAPRRRRPTGAAAWTVVALVLVFLAGVVVVPLGALFATVLSAPGEVVRGLTRPEALYALWLSVVIAAICLVVNGAVGVVGALVLVRQRFVGRWLLDALVDLPLAISPVMTGLGFLLLFGRSGVLQPVLQALDLKVAFAFPGLVLATLFVTVPFTLREVALVLEELGTTEEQAAATLGASAWQTFWRVTLPNVRHALVVGSTLTTARALGEFGAVLVLGGAIANHTDTATTFIHGAIEERQQPAAYGMALLLAAFAILLLIVLERTKRPATRLVEAEAEGA